MQNEMSLQSISRASADAVKVIRNIALSFLSDHYAAEIVSIEYAQGSSQGFSVRNGQNQS